MHILEHSALESSGSILRTVFDSAVSIIINDKKQTFHLIYFAFIQAVLALSIPIASGFIINNVVSHAQISIITLGVIVGTIFLLITFLQILQSSIIENFQQKIFLTTAIDLSIKATDPTSISSEKKEDFIKYMNYFFDITSIQKFFPTLLLGGVGIIVQITVSLALLFIFNATLFYTGAFFFALYIFLLFFIGRHAPKKAVERSNAKHDVFFSLQHILDEDETRKETLDDLNSQLHTYVKSRNRLFRIILKQISLTYLIEGVVFVGFMLIGASLVISGELPIGDFIAAEIIIVAIIYTLKSFVKQLEYIYDAIEGFYKIEKLKNKIGVE